MATTLALTRTQRSTRAVAEALFQGPDGPPPAARLDWLVADVADFLRHAGTRARGMFQLCLFLVSWLAPLWIFRLPPLRRLNLDDRVRALTRFEDSQLGSSLVLACKAVLCMVYFEDEEAARELMDHEPGQLRRLPLFRPGLAAAESALPPEAALGAEAAP